MSLNKLTGWGNLVERELNWNKAEKYIVNSNERGKFTHNLLQNGSRAYLIKSRLLLEPTEFKYYTKLRTNNEINRSLFNHRYPRRHMRHMEVIEPLFKRSPPYSNINFKKITWDNVKPVIVVLKSEMAKEIGNMNRAIKKINDMALPNSKEKKLNEFKNTYKNVLTKLNKTKLTPSRKERLNNVKNLINKQNKEIKIFKSKKQLFRYANGSSNTEN
jgi:hypothetical protein